MMVKLKCAGRSALCAGGILLALSIAPVSGQAAEKPTAAPRPEASAAAAQTETKAEPAPAVSLSEILKAMEALEAGERRFRLLLADEKRVRALAVEIDDAEKAFSGIRKMAGDALNDLVGFHELVDLTNNLHAADRRIAAATDELAAKARALDAALDRLTATLAKSAAWIETARTRQASAAVRQRIESLAPRSEALTRALRSHRDQVLEVLAKATQLRATLIALREEVSDRRDQLTARLRTERREPIWRVESHPGEQGRVMQFFDVQMAQSYRHAREHAGVLLAIAVVVFALTYWLIIATHERLAAQAETDPYARHTGDLFRVPGVAALAAAFTAVIVFGPPGPFNYHLVLLALVLVPATVLARAVVGPQAAVSLYTLAGAVISQALLSALLDPLPLASRLLVIAQCGSVAVALGVDLRAGRLQQALSALPANLVRWTAAGTIILLAVAVLATISGHLGIARVLRNLVLGGLGFALLLAVGVALLYGLALAVTQTSFGRGLRIVRAHRDSLRYGLRTGLIALAVVAWVSGVVSLMGLADYASRIVDALYNAEITIGSTSIDLTGVWIGFAVMLGTFVLVKAMGPVLEVEILPRLTRKQGIPFAVSAVARYLLVTAGVLLAMAAMGIDLTKVTLLAGALGVGIGFGLQSIVNNFVSGLILLMERPISIGDVVQMGQLRGVVKRVGVRSTTVQTPQGAEVIVPNADLISKEVTNWTLSDRRRRLEIDVGVAYGTEPEQVVQLLKTVASEVADVAANPPPSAQLTGFGDSALNFRLEAWVDDYSRGGATESALRMAIEKKLREANIEIPFPQRDLHIRAAPAAPVPK